MPASTLTKTSPDVAKMLELSGAMEHLEFYSARPRAIEVATRSALETLFAELDRPPQLPKLQDVEDIWKAVHLQAEILERFLTIHNSLSRAFAETIPEILESESGESASNPLKHWLYALKKIERNPPETRRLLKVAYSASLHSYARAGKAGIAPSQDDYIIEAPPPGEMLDVTTAADRLAVSRPTIYQWLKKQRLIGWERGSKQGWVIPAEQIAGPEQIVKGVSEVLSAIGDPELAWDFLSNPYPFAGGGARPIAKLIEGGDAAQEVLDTAPGYLMNMG